MTVYSEEFENAIAFQSTEHWIERIRLRTNQFADKMETALAADKQVDPFEVTVFLEGLLGRVNFLETELMKLKPEGHDALIANLKTHQR